MSKFDVYCASVLVEFGILPWMMRDHSARGGSHVEGEYETIGLVDESGQPCCVKYVAYLC